MKISALASGSSGNCFFVSRGNSSILVDCGISCKQVLEKLEAICIFEKFKLNKRVLRKAIDIYRENNFSFVDAYLCALSVTGKYANLYSFDERIKKLYKQLSVTI